MNLVWDKHSYGEQARSMPSVYDLKPKFQSLLRPVTRALAAAGVTANQVTLAALILSLGYGALIAGRPGARWPLWGLPIFLFVRMALNAIDGMLAREHGMKSRLGGLLNELGDVLSDAALYLPLGLVPGLPLFPIAVIVALAGASELTGVLTQAAGGERRYDGPMGKSDRAFVFGALGLALGLGAPPAPWAPWLLGVIIALLVVTIINRARRGLASAAQAAEGPLAEEPLQDFAAPDPNGAPPQTVTVSYRAWKRMRARTRALARARARTEHRPPRDEET